MCFCGFRTPALNGVCVCVRAHPRNCSRVCMCVCLCVCVILIRANFWQMKPSHQILDRGTPLTMTSFLLDGVSITTTFPVTVCSRWKRTSAIRSMAYKLLLLLLLLRLRLRLLLLLQLLLLVLTLLICRFLLENSQNQTKRSSPIPILNVYWSCRFSLWQATQRWCCWGVCEV